MKNTVKTDDIIFNFFKQICDEKDDDKCVELGNKWIEAMETNLNNIEKNLDIDDQVFWSNAIKDETKWGALYLSQGMVLCSNGENFGVSLVESLSLGKPVLTTNKVNIYNKIKKKV